MNAKPKNLAAACMILALLPAMKLCGAADSMALMPLPGDQTQMWWAEGFPSHSPQAPWLRVIQTGRFALALNTETLRVAHLGPVSGLEDDYHQLPAADLDLSLTIDGKKYHGASGGKWSRFTGPRLIDSGRFFQRADVTNVEFKADDGSRLNVEARFETAAWPDRLALILAAMPGLQSIVAGESSFGRIHGGFGLDGANHLEIAHQAALDPEKFTLELWAFVPADYRVSQRTPPWLACKNRNEAAEGNFGLMIVNGRPQARMNIGGGSQNAITLEPGNKAPLKLDAWHHLAVSYDGEVLRLYVDGALAGGKKIGRKRVPGHDALAFGRRQDNSGDGYHFRGVLDEIRLYDRALSLEELRPHWLKPDSINEALKPIGEWTFDPRGQASMAKVSESWKDAALEIRLASSKGELKGLWQLPKNEAWTDRDWHTASLALDPVAFKACAETSAVKIAAAEMATGTQRPVNYDAALGWHCINLDDIEPTAPPGGSNPSNDALERVKLVLSNDSDQQQMARLMFEKTTHGIRQRIGTPITGVSAILRDAKGEPTGIPVQLSKDWHNEPEGGVYASQWFHGISQLRLPAKARIEVELTLAYGHWGGVPAASHAQLCLIGWGSNQLWDQSALGAWGESICYEADQVQANCTITDVRPAMVKSTSADKPWGWTGNVGGGDFLRLFDLQGNRVPHAAMRTTYHKQGPCLTEVTYAGRIGANLTHSATVSLARTDDFVRGVYRLKLDVKAATDFSRLAIFQIGADTYSSSNEHKMALGNEGGLIKEWDAQWGGNAYRTSPMECTGRIPWISLHDVVPDPAKQPNTLANRGIIIRSWKARLGGKEAAPYIAEHGLTLHKHDSSTLDLVPPPGITHLLPGDYIDAVIEQVIMPRAAAEYYGPNQELRKALTRDANTWRMIEREAVGNERRVEMKTGSLQGAWPGITVAATDDRAEFQLTGGVGYVPVTFAGLTSPHGHAVMINGQTLNQSIHGNDFWQADYDAVSQRWSLTFNVFCEDKNAHVIQLTSP